MGVISSWDDVNSILMAGRADLCALGRVHLYDPSWTLHAAVEHLRENGAPIDREPVVGRDGNWQAWTRDPDGNDIELMQLSEESPQWRTARSAERGGT